MTLEVGDPVSLTIGYLITRPHEFKVTFKFQNAKLGEVHIGLIPTTILHGAATQRTVNSVFTTVKTLDPTCRLLETAVTFGEGISVLTFYIYIQI